MGVAGSAGDFRLGDGLGIEVESGEGADRVCFGGGVFDIEDVELGLAQGFGFGFALGEMGVKGFHD